MRCSFVRLCQCNVINSTRSVLNLLISSNHLHTESFSLFYSCALKGEGVGQDAVTYLYRNDDSQCLTALSLLSDIIASYGSSQYREYYSLTECAMQQHALMKLDASRRTELIPLIHIASSIWLHPILPIFFCYYVN